MCNLIPLFSTYLRWYDRALQCNTNSLHNCCINSDLELLWKSKGHRCINPNSGAKRIRKWRAAYRSLQEALSPCSDKQWSHLPISCSICWFSSTDSGRAKDPPRLAASRAVRVLCEKFHDHKLLQHSPWMRSVKLRVRGCAKGTSFNRKWRPPDKWDVLFTTHAIVPVESVAAHFVAQEIAGSVRETSSSQIV